MKNILITGASGGIGSAIATELASPGCSLFLHYYQGEQQIQKIKRECEELGAVVYLVKANLLADNGDQELLACIPEQLPFNTIIHNAGTSHFGLFTDMTNMELEEMMNIHLMNPMKITRTLLPGMLSQKQGKIIVISSIWGVTGASCEVLYSTAKAGLNGFVKALAKEIAPSNIQVNGVAPGAIETEMLRQQTDDILDELKTEIPANRLGKPEEVSQLVSFLQSDRASYINGQILSINGAWYC
ncbi:elongation factor P 5-aminopentanone reductase [Bacillus suaedae]|uniref:SDR family oxidoreductase n=1 Tax=Halalkalibacter suaedae TaxID=2822140 RepID=A0A941ATJ3_9BACI|nr:SDR family oxidoreductase [Bacillus suaedae]MBP3951974.1 SDR family oxidoreductase [Bacillus suaedae]